MKERSDFIEFVGQLVDGEDLDAPARGIAAKVVEAGHLSGLTEQQHAAFVIGLKNWLAAHFPEYASNFVPYPEEPPAPTCAECPEQVPWCEVYAAAAMFHGRCSYCEQVRHKDD